MLTYSDLTFVASHASYSCCGLSVTWASIKFFGKALFNYFAKHENYKKLGLSPWFLVTKYFAMCDLFISLFNILQKDMLINYFPPQPPP